MRTDPQPAAAERTTLVEFLEFHRETVLQKVAGLTHEQLNRSLLKHLAGVEDSWFTDRLLGLGEPEPFASVPSTRTPTGSSTPQCTTRPSTWSSSTKRPATAAAPPWCGPPTSTR